MASVRRRAMAATSTESMWIGLFFPFLSVGAWQRYRNDFFLFEHRCAESGGLASIRW